LTILLGGAAVFLAAKHATQHVMAQTNLNVRPFVFEQVHYVIDPTDGKEVVEAIDTVARSRSGAIVHAGTLYHDGKAYTGLRKIELPNSFVGLVVDSLKSKTTAYRPDSVLAESKMSFESKSGCSQLGYTNDGEEIIAGQRTVRIVGVNADQLTRLTIWQLPDFNCQTVQATIDRRSSPTGDWQLSSGSHLTKFAPTDPDPALFSGFATYTEISPSQLTKRVADQEGITAPACPKCKDADKTYADWNK
jgi:hypothetical protein